MTFAPHTQHTHTHRVCAPGEDGKQFTSLPDIHTFPPAHLSTSHTLHVSVQTLPRQTSPPRLFLPAHSSAAIPSQYTDEKREQCSRTHYDCADSASMLGKSPRHKHSVDDLSNQLSRMSVNDNAFPNPTMCRPIESKGKNTDSFPFSPPEPSPMSPKLLAGLADILPFRTHRITDAHRSTGCAHVEQFCFDKSCVGDDTTEADPKKHVTDEVTPVLTSTNSRNVLPPSASSPMPYFRVRSHSNDHPGSMMNKRRSCAISVKVSKGLTNSQYKGLK